jgi:hypothetical protein
MERWDDPLYDMRDSWQLRHRRSFEPPVIDDGTAGRVLDGLDPADAPPAYADTARSLAALRGPGQPDELASEAAVVVAFAARVAQPLEPARLSRRIPKASRIASPKLATAAVAGGLALSGGLAAAATGSLPGAAQSIASEVLSRVGIQVPSPNTHAGSHPDTRGSSDTSGSSDLRGSSSTGASNIPAGPGPGVQGSTISHLAQTTPATGVGKGAAICTAASGAQCEAGQHGAGTGTGAAAPVAAPNHGGTGTANTASGGASRPGTTSGNSASGGASSAGSGNATPQGGSTTANTASGGASSAGAGNVIAHPGFSAANSASGGRQ